MIDEAATRAAMVAACKAMNTLGLNQGMSGNISVRLEARMLITPTATPYDIMVAADMASMTIEDQQAKHQRGALQERPLGHSFWRGPRRPSSEWRMHCDILAARREFGAVVHAHPHACTTLAIMRRAIPPCHYMVATFGGEDVRCAGYATFGTQALSDCVLEALQDRSACLLANHGMIACGRDLDQAMWRAVELEALARQYLASLSMGGPVLLTQAQIISAMKQFEDYRP